MPQRAAEENAPITIASDSSPGPFEGPEKLLELWFAPSEAHVTERGLPIKGGRKGKAKWTGLRQIERSVWDSMLDEVQCKVLSVIEGEEVDAYLLSESSMFVWPHKLILKTCGTTTLLLGLPTLLRIASETCGLNGVWRCFYSRKTFMFPDRQRGPHKDWAQEMSFLDQLFENSSAYTVGKMNGDHWLLYLTPPQDDVLLPNALASSSALPPTDPSTPLSTLTDSLESASLSLPPPPRPLLPKPSRAPVRPDQTLEILMSRLAPSSCAAFYHPSSTPSPSYDSPSYASSPASTDSHALGASLSDSLGLTGLMPKATIDSFLFSPCGFSSNAVQGDRYATVHVTPEEEYSYASFETNLAFGTGNDEELVEGGPQSLPELVERVLGIFKPARFSITLFVSMDDEGEEEGRGRKQAHGVMRELMNPDLLETHKVVDKILYEFDGYSLVYLVMAAIA